MQGSVDRADHIHMVAPQIEKGFSSCSDKRQKVDYRGKSGTCNLCSAPCTSCFHINQVLMKSTDESAGETWAENIALGHGKRRETRELSEMSTVEAMVSTSDSSENAVGKASSRISDASASNDTVMHSKIEVQKALEGYDDCLSCDSETNEASKVLAFATRKVDNINLPCSSVSTSCPAVEDDDHLTLSELGNKKCDMEHGKINYNKLCKFSDKVPSSSVPIVSPGNPGLFEIPVSKSTDDGTDSIRAQDTSSVKSLLCDPNSRDMEEDKLSAPQGEPLEGSSKQLNSMLTREEVTNVCGDLPTTVLKSTGKNDDMEVEIHPTDETDDSDMVEQDVKVCDICGDAGREDLLAICCRCSDGAEHTYCMREMLAKVPEDDWLCEECKSVEQLSYQRQDKIGWMDENEKNNSSGQASSEHVHSSDVEGNRTRGCLTIPGKRLRDDADTDAEVSSIVKKQAVESIVGSPKPSKSSKTASLSRESSSKNLDRGRVQSSHGGPSSDAASVNDTPELARSVSDLRLQNFRGTFSKSNSFTSLNLKPKVKLVDQVLQRQKSVREVSPLRLKEDAKRAISNSMSFKSTNSIRSESKTKMLSPRLSNIQDLKKTKQRSSFERQSAFKSEHALVNPMTATSMSSVLKSDKKLAGGSELYSLSIPINQQETKPVQPDGKSLALSRSLSLASRRSADLSSPSGEFKRPSLYGHSTPGASPTNGNNNMDKKSNHSSQKEDSSSCSGVSERPPANANEGLPDGFCPPRELTNYGEPLREHSGSRFRPSYVKSSRDESSNLKAAIEAAVLRKPGVYRKHRSDDSSASSTGCDTSSKDHLSSSAGRRMESSAAEVPEKITVSRNLTADSHKHETLNTVKHFQLEPVEARASGGDEVRIVPLDGKSSSRDDFSNVAAAMSFSLKSLAIPEHEYIWQGSFEIYRSGKILISWDGIQAHLSTCTSPKVIEAVNKFKSRIVLHEVPRLSTWPIQFQEHGVGEENIALFFFAKDLEFYDKIYKVWLENMMKNDLALKGNLNGVELLIFPSNQLPENSQRWNMLFFLWGVFRGNKESYLQHSSVSLKQFSAPRNLPPAIMSLPENRCSPRSVAKDLPACDDVPPETKVHASEDLSSLLSTRAVNEDYGVKKSSLDWLASRQNSSSSITIRGARVKQCQELRDTCKEGGINSSCSPFQSMSSIACSGRERMLMQLDTPLDRQQSIHHLDKSPDGTLDMSPEEGVGTAILDKMNCSQDQEKLRMDAEDLSTVVEVPIGVNQETRGPNMDLNRWLMNRKEYLHPESTYMAPQALHSRTNQALPKTRDTHNEPRGALEKMNRLASGSREVENRCHDTCDETVILEHSENAERSFFPLELHPVKGIQLLDRSLPWKIHQSDQNRFHDKVPNLELALGAERKPLTQGIQPLTVGKIERKTTEEHIPSKTAIKAKDDDDVSAALSLSLSFPFPKEEQTTKPARKAEQLVSQRDHSNTSMIFFRNLGDK